MGDGQKRRRVLYIRLALGTAFLKTTVQNLGIGFGGSIEKYMHPFASRTVTLANTKCTYIASED
jgi:hypothetical protein